MKHVVRKVYWNYEKEEKWLNEMAAKGLELTDYSWCRYVFTDGIPGEYIYRMELLKNSSKHLEGQRYITFMEENGIEHIASYMRWVYFRKKTIDGSFNIYSDIESKITHYKRINLLWSIGFAINIVACLYNIILSIYIMVKDISYPIYISICFGAISLMIVILVLFGLILPNRKRIKKLTHEKKIRE